jgi:hypothetical protein
MVGMIRDSKPLVLIVEDENLVRFGAVAMVEEAGLPGHYQSMPARRIEGYAIVSDDGMIANSAGVMPDSLKLEADRRFFERGMDAMEVSVHGRHSHEQQPRSKLRSRIVLTRRIAGVASHPSNPKAVHQQF